MRKVTFIDSKSQSQKVINNSTATTLGELKAEMRTAGINYTDMSFYEGHIRAELLDDNSILPTDIPYKGQVVNDLVFMLSTTNKKIKSGIDRKEVYELIKKYNLQDKVNRAFGKNFTQVSTADLMVIVNKNTPAVVSEESAPAAVPTVLTCSERFHRIETVLVDILDILADESIIDEEEYDDLVSNFDYLEDKEANQPMTSQEIDEMFNFMN